MTKDRESISRDNLRETRNKFKRRQPFTSVQKTNVTRRETNDTVRVSLIFAMQYCH